MWGRSKAAVYWSMKRSKLPTRGCALPLHTGSATLEEPETSGQRVIVITRVRFLVGRLYLWRRRPTL